MDLLEMLKMDPKAITAEQATQEWVALLSNLQDERRAAVFRNVIDSTLADIIIARMKDDPAFAKVIGERIVLFTQNVFRNVQRAQQEQFNQRLKQAMGKKR